MTIRPRRSVLYMPGVNARALEKARTLPVDGVVIDLEDAVAPDAKASAREATSAAVRAGGFGGREVFIRTNAAETAWFADDLAAAAQAAPDGVVVPKVSSAETLALVGARLRALGADPRLRVWAMLESPIAFLRVAEIAAAGRDGETRLAGFILGTNDLLKETYGRVVPGRWPLVPPMMTAVLAARAYGLAILDGVYNDLADAKGFRAECEQARDMGFDGKTLVHPSQIAPCNEVFSPGEDELAQARKIMRAFEQPENRGKGVVQIDGRMVERMHAEMARRVVLTAQAIAGRG